MTRSHAATVGAAALLLGAACCYVVTLTDVHTFDALSYVTSVERKPWQEVFHPHHLAYGPLGTLALAAGRALGYAGGAALPMQMVNALAGALGVALLFGVVVRLTERVDLGLVAALLMGTAYAYWYYAVEIEVYTVAAVLLIVCLGLMTRMAQLSLRRPGWLYAALGLAQAGAVLFHQTNVLLCGPILVLAIADLVQARRDRMQFWPVIGRWAVYALVAALAVLLPYLWVGFAVSRFATFAAFERWMTEYARTGWWGGPLTATKLAGFREGLSQTLTPVGGGWAWLALGVVGAAGMAGHRRAADAHGRAPLPLGLALVTWLLAYGGFFLWWEPDNIEFWIASLPPALTMLALALRRTKAWSVAPLSALAIAIILGWTNYGAIEQRGDASTDLQRQIARALAERSTPADLLIIPDGLQELYLPYYEQRENFISINQALFDANDVWPEACATIQRRIEVALHAGATALIAQEALHPPALVLERHRLEQGQVEACFAPYQAAFEPLVLPQQVPPYVYIPPAQRVVERGGWVFSTAPQGWQAANVTGQHFAGGWEFVPGSDPSITSPLLRIDTAHYRALELRLANGTAARDAQVFFLGEDGRADERHSARWQLAPGHEPTNYTLDLAQTPGWQGIVTRLRIDPVGVGDGGTMRVEWVRLVQR